MPRVSKIRLTNVRLDENLKVIPNQIWDLRNESSVFFLENGGGKTSVIQIIHQVVTPNISIQGRQLMNTVAKRSTFHIAIEWQSDDHERPGFITGFSFYNHGIKTAKSNTPYDYISYVYDLSDNDFSIEELPFIANGNVNTLMSLESELRRKPGTLTFKNKVKDYTNALENYSIFQSEWASIAKVNGDEGGVKGFFEKAKTTETLISRLLIPSLEGSLYESEEESQSILTTIKKHKDTLMSLPKMEKNIQDFQVIQEHSDQIIDAATELGEARKALAEVKTTLGSLHRTVEEAKEKNERTLDEWEEQVVQLGEEIQYDKYAIDSYAVHAKQQEKEVLLVSQGELAEQVEQKQKDVTFYQQKTEEQRAAKHFMRYEEHKGDFNKETAVLNAMTMDEGEKSNFYQSVLKKVSIGNSYLLAKLKGKLKETTEKIKGNKTFLASRTQASTNLNQQLLETTKRKSELDYVLKTYREEKEVLSEQLGECWNEDLELAKQCISEKIEASQQFIQNRKEQKQSLEIEKEEAKLDKAKTGFEIKNIGEKLKEKKKLLNDYNETVLRVSNDVYQLLQMSASGKLFTEKDYIYKKVSSVLEKNNAEILELNIQSKQLDMDITLLTENGYTVQPELKEMKEFLYGKGVDTILGVEYLLNSNISEQEKEEMVKANPLISFSLVFENREIGKLERALEKNEQSLNIPIVLIPRESLDSKDFKGSVMILEGESYVYHQFENRLTKQDWSDYQEELEQKMVELSEKKETIEMNLQRYLKIQHVLDHFYDTYSSQSETEFLRDIQRAEEEVVYLEEKENSLVETIAQLADVIATIQKELEQQESELSQSNWNQNRLRLFQNKYEDIIQKKTEQEQMESAIENLNKELRVIEQEINEVSKDNDSLSMENTQLNKVIVLLENDKKELGLSDEIPEETATSVYEEEKALLKQRGKEISAEEEKRKETAERIQKYQRKMEEEEREIKRYHYSLEFFTKNSIRFDESLLDEMIFQQEENLQELEVLKSELREIESKIASTKDMIAFLLANIEKTHGKQEIFLFEEEPEKELEIIKKELKDKQSSLQRVNQNIQMLKGKQKDFAYAIENLEAIQTDIANKQDVELLKEEEWDQEKPMNTFRSLNGSHKKLVEEMAKKEANIAKEIEQMIEKINKIDNSQLRIMSNKLKVFLERNSADDEQLIRIFLNLNEAVDGYRQSEELLRNELKNNEEQIIDMMYKRSEELYVQIRELEKSSVVKMGDERNAMIKISWPKEEEIDAIDNFSWYIKKLMEDVKEMELKGESTDEMDKFLNRELKMENILNNFARLNRCRVLVLKPRNKLLDRKDYISWNEASAWSGGERHSFQITMFITLNSLLRKKRVSREDVSKFLIIDNPFGAASSEHIVKPMIELAKSTNTQLFCLTDIRNEVITSSFGTVISNKYIHQLGTLMMSSEVEHNSAMLDTLNFNRV